MPYRPTAHWVSRADACCATPTVTPAFWLRSTDMYKRLVIIGGGFAGMKAAQALEHTLPPDWTLTLISQENFITFNPLLPEVVGASILPGHVIAPHRQMIHCSHACMAQVTEIDTVNRVVQYLGEGPGRGAVPRRRSRPDSLRSIDPGLRNERQSRHRQGDVELCIAAEDT